MCIRDRVYPHNGAAGRIGIGTSTPVTNLDITQVGNNGRFLAGILAGAGTYGGLGFESTLTSTNYSLAGVAGGETLLNGATEIEFRIANNMLGSLQASGLGIGPTTPAAKIDILQTDELQSFNINDGASNSVLAVADGGGLTLKPAAFDSAQHFNDDGSVFTNNTTEAKTTQGTAFTVLNTENPSLDVYYIGPVSYTHLTLPTNSRV